MGDWFEQFTTAKAPAQPSVESTKAESTYASAPTPAEQTDADWFEGKGPPAINPPEGVENTTLEQSEKTYEDVTKAEGKAPKSASTPRGRQKKDQSTQTQPAKPGIGVVVYVQCIPMNATVPDYTELYFAVQSVLLEKTGKHPAELSYGDAQKTMASLLSDAFENISGGIFVPKGAPYADLFVAVATAKGATIIRGVW